MHFTCFHIMFKELLRNRNKVQEIVWLLDPIVRSLDGIVGERVALRVIYYEILFFKSSSFFTNINLMSLIYLL